MEQIIKILMRRDGNTRSEAKARCEDVKDMLEDCNYDPEESERIFMSQLGLEMDYMEDFLLELYY